MPYCTNCGSETGTAKFCPECGSALEASAKPKAAESAPGGTGHTPGIPGGGQEAAGGQGAPGSQTIDPRMAGALAYFWPLAIIFLFAEPHKRIRFVRFHSLQSIFLVLGLTVVAIGFGILSLVPLLGWIAGIFGLFLPLVWVGGALFLGLKAYGGEEPHLPIIGDLAEKQCS